MDRRQTGRTALERLRPMVVGPLAAVVLVLPVLEAEAAAEDNGRVTTAQQVGDSFHESLRAMRGYTFQRRVVRETLDADGEARSRQTLVMRITPLEVDFDEQLIEIDGREPTAREVRSHRRDAVFSTHYREMLAGSVEMAVVADLELSELLAIYDYRLVGEERLDGQPTRRYVIKPFTVSPGSPRTVQIAGASEGSLWLTREGQLVRLESRLARPLSAGGLGMDELELKFDLAPHDGTWLIRRIELRAALRAVVKTFRRHNIWTYSDFEPL